MRTVLLIALLFFCISAQGQKFSSGMTKRATVLSTDEILIKAAGTTPPQFTTPVELLAGRAVTPDQLGDSLATKVSIGDTINVLDALHFNPATDTVATKAELRATALLYADLSANISTTSTTLVNATGLSLSLDASSTYIVEFMIVGSNDTVSTPSPGNVGFGINLSSVTGASVIGAITGTLFFSERVLSSTNTIYAFNTVAADFFKYQNLAGSATFTGRIKTGSVAPTIQVQYQTSAGQFLIFAGSYITALKVE